MRRPSGLVGLLLADKPTGATSHDIVSWARKRLGERRIGHAGTLDPLASGLLPLLVGPATRLVPYLHDWPKTYVGVVLLGLETETGDLDGVDTAGFVPPPLPPRAVLEAAAARLTGRQMQTPPVYSAKKIGGTPAHELARHGRPPVLPAVEVTVHRLRFFPAGRGRLAFAARVSSGTYIRSLARDLGRLLGTGGCLAALRRTAIGPLRAHGAIPARAEATGEALLSALLPPEAIPLPLPVVRLDEGGADRFRGGREVEGDPAGLAGATRVLGPDDRLEGIGEFGPEGRLAPRVVLRGGVAGVGRSEQGNFFVAEDPGPL